MESTQDSTKYPQIYTDEVVLAAMEEIFKRPTTTASKVAKMLGANPVHMRRVMLDMKNRNVIKGQLDGKNWEFFLE